MNFLRSVFLLGVLYCGREAMAQVSWQQDFAAQEDGSGARFASWQDAKAQPKVENGALHLLSGAAKERNGVLFAPIIPRSAWVEASFELRTKGGDGAGVVFYDAAQVAAGRTEYRMFGDWDEPNLARAFGVGFDTLNPPEKNPFNKNGNIDDQPQREVSLHWNAIEQFNRRSETEFRAQSATDEFVPVRIRLDYVTGGANVSVWVRGHAVYDAVFVPDVKPMDMRLALGAHSEAEGAFCDVRRVQVRTGASIAAPQPALSVGVISREPLTITRPRIEGIAQFPTQNLPYGRILARLTLADVSPAIDAWDRLGKIYLYDEKGERFELVRFITSYGRAMDWAIDVSDFRPLLVGKKRIEIECVTYSAGWTASLSFDFVPGSADQYAYKVVNLWNGEVEIGNPQKPVANFWKPRVLARPGDADSAAIRIMTTGHGGLPNSKNAAEFMPLGRTLSVGKNTFSNTLWKTDNYLNPLRPQGGTWKYSRAGWAPGSVVDPWKIDISSSLERGKGATVGYEIEPYTNENAGKGNPPFYQFEATAIFYKRKP